jgi:hypothetical protein
VEKKALVHDDKRVAFERGYVDDFSAPVVGRRLEGSVFDQDFGNREDVILLVSVSLINSLSGIGFSRDDKSKLAVDALPGSLALDVFFYGYVDVGHFLEERATTAEGIPTRAVRRSAIMSSPILKSFISLMIFSI